MEKEKEYSLNTSAAASIFYSTPGGRAGYTLQFLPICFNRSRFVYYKFKGRDKSRPYGGHIQRRYTSTVRDFRFYPCRVSVFCCRQKMLF